MSKNKLSNPTLQVGEYHFHEVFNRIRKNLGIKTQASLAEILGVQHQTVSEAKRTTGIFPIKWAVILSEKYDLSLDFILKGKEAKPIALHTPKNKSAKQALHYLVKASAEIMSLDNALENQR